VVGSAATSDRSAIAIAVSRRLEGRHIRDGRIQGN